MTVLVEGNLQITIQNAISARRFDDPDTHGLSHCMKAVDFVVEFSDYYLFIEIKDPQHPDAPERETNRFARSFLSGELDDDLRFKYRDSLLYKWAEERADKPVDYLVLIALDRLGPSDLLDRQEELQRILPLQRPGPQPWPRPLVRSCGVFNIESWNRSFPALRVSRLP